MFLLEASNISCLKQTHYLMWYLVVLSTNGNEIQKHRQPLCVADNNNNRICTYCKLLSWHQRLWGHGCRFPKSPSWSRRCPRASARATWSPSQQRVPTQPPQWLAPGLPPKKRAVMSMGARVAPGPLSQPSPGASTAARSSALAAARVFLIK